MSEKLFAWKRISDGSIAQQYAALSKDDLFEAAGFGAVEVDKPIKGYLAVEVVRDEQGSLVEAQEVKG